MTERVMVDVPIERVMVGAYPIEFVVQRSQRQKTISIKVSAVGITVKAPQAAPLAGLHALVRHKAQGILEQQQRLKRLQARTDPPKCFISGESVRLYGDRFILKRFTTSNLGVVLRGRILELHACSDEHAALLLKQWYIAQALDHATARVVYWAKRLGIQAPIILIREQQGRWGSCNQKGELRLNWRIVKAPQSLFDYVIAHELCHLRVPNHSAEFWLVLRQIMPDYAARRDRLAREGRLYSQN